MSVIKIIEPQNFMDLVERVEVVLVPGVFILG